MILPAIHLLERKFQRLSQDEILVVAHNHHYYYVTGVFAEKRELHLVSASALLIGETPETAKFPELHLIIVSPEWDQINPGDNLYTETIAQGLRNTYKKEVIEFIHWADGFVPTEHWYAISIKKK
jgi:hypothetical protein